MFPHILFSLLFIAPLGLTVVALIDAALRPRAAWTAAGHRKAVSMLVMAVFWAWAPMIYFLVTRPKLTAPPA